jgi:hypothetical protein
VKLPSNLLLQAQDNPQNNKNPSYSSDSLGGMFKKAFHMGGHGKKDNVDDIQPLGHGAHGEAPTVRV